MTHVHQLVLAASQDDLVAAVLSFVRSGQAAGEPTVLSVAPRTAAALRDELGGGQGQTIWLDHREGRRPGTDLARFTKLVRDATAAGTRVRVINEIPPELCRNWYEWRRYEAVVNVAHAGLDLWGLCVYDERQLSPGMIEDLRRTHPFIGTRDDQVTNVDYEEPRAFCDEHFDAPADPVEQAKPALELLDPSPAATRAALRDLVNGGSPLSGDDAEALVLAAHEAVTNAAAHGQPPVRLRAWVAPGRVVVTVSDTGHGPQDSFLGLLYSRERQGMWLSHQLVDVAHRRHPGGYTVRMTAPAGQSVA